MMLASIKVLLVKIISLLKDIRHELHDSNEQIILKENRYGSGEAQLNLPKRGQRRSVHPESIGEHKITLDIDTTKVLEEIKQLKEEIFKLPDSDVGHIVVPDIDHKTNPFKGKGVIASKEPYVIPPCFRIEFDAIHDVPKVYVNGVDITDTEYNHLALQELNIDWVTDDYCKRPKRFYLKYIDSYGTHRIIDRGNVEGGVKIDG